MKRTESLLSLSALLLLWPTVTVAADNQPEPGFVSLFNGKDIAGWRASENGTWKVEDGVLVASGPRSHLYTDEHFKNFDFKADVKTTPGSNSGIYFHTKFNPDTWPVEGYECQVNQSHKDPIRTGSLYRVVHVFDTPVKDDEWYTQEIIVDNNVAQVTVDGVKKNVVRGKKITVKVNDKVLFVYTEPEGVKGPIKLSEGSFCLQQHDPKSVTYYRNIRVKRLPD